MTTSAIRRTKLNSRWIGLRDGFSTWSCRPVYSGVAFVLFGLVIFFGIFSQANAQVSKVVFLDQSRNTIDLWPNLTILFDPTHALTISDVLAKQDQFQAIRSPYANLGMRKDTVWLRTDIALSKDAPADWWLSVDIVLLDEIDLYVVEQEQITQHLSAPVQPVLARRSSAFRRPVFQLALQPGRHYPPASEYLSLP